MDPEFWQSRWRDNDIGFHQPHIHQMLADHWPSLELRKDARVFVPLCGKSRDMVWLVTQGHSVVGVDLADIAVRDFFAEQALTPEVSNVGTLTCHAADPYQLLVGDIFDVAPDLDAPFDAAYDRAALVALTAEQRQRYATHLATLMPPSSKVLLITLDYPAGELQGPPFAVTPDEIMQLFSDTFDIRCLEDRDGLEASANLKSRGVTRLNERATLLVRKP